MSARGPGSPRSPHGLGRRASGGRTSERAPGAGQVRTRPRRTWRGRHRPRALLAGPGRGTGPGFPGRGSGGRDKGPARSPRAAGAAGGRREPAARAPTRPQLPKSLPRRRHALGRGAAEPPGRPGHCPSGPRPPTRGGGQAAAEREQQQQRRRRRPGRRRLHVVRSRTGPRRAHLGSMARRPRLLARLRAPAASPLGRRGPGRRGRRQEARERKPRRVSAPRRRRRRRRPPAPHAPAAPSSGRPPEPARGEAAAARGPRGSARAPGPLGPAAGAPRGSGVGRRVCTPRGSGADQVPEAGVLPVELPGRGLTVGETEARGRGVRRGLPESTR